MLEINKIHQGNCLDLMKDIEDKKIDMILCDLPYGTTSAKWDTVIPFEELWEQYNRIIKDNGAIVLTASQPFTSALVMSNPKMFKYAWVWKKSKCGNFMNAKIQPLKYTEDILVFSKNKHTYNPIMREAGESTKNRRSYKLEGTKKEGTLGEIKGDKFKWNDKTFNGMINPSNLLEIKSVRKTLHPTQKPVELFEYLVKTYTNEGDLVLDNCIGSGTTAIACMNTSRNWIGIEMEEEYVDLANERINNYIFQ